MATCLLPFCSSQRLKRDASCCTSRRFADGTEQLLQPAVPFLIHGLSSTAAFTVSLAAAQVSSIVRSVL